jgi:hypothetical protein
MVARRLARAYVLVVALWVGKLIIDVVGLVSAAEQLIQPDSIASTTIFA